MWDRGRPEGERAGRAESSTTRAGAEERAERSVPSTAAGVPGVRCTHGEQRRGRAVARHGTPYSSFPARCQVRGCRASPQEWYEQGRTTFEVCHEHGLHLRAGEARSVDGDELLLGPDSAPALFGVRHLRSAAGPLLTSAGRHGVCAGDHDPTPACARRWRAARPRESPGPDPRRTARSPSARSLPAAARRSRRSTAAGRSEAAPVLESRTFSSGRGRRPRAAGRVVRGGARR